MFNQSKKIVAITKEKILGVHVIDPVAKKFGPNFEVAWTHATFELSLSEVIKKLNSKDVRVLVSDDLGYVVRMQVPKDIPRGKTREFVLAELQNKIPDEIKEGEWDFKELKGSDGSDRSVIAFVLVKSFAEILFKAVVTQGINVEAIEPETLAKTRDSNPYIGLTLKSDLEGKDEDVLNLRPSVPQKPGSPVSSNPGFDLKLFFLVLIPIVLVGVLVGGLVYFGVTRQSLPSPTPEPGEVEEITQEQTTQTPEEVVVNPADLSIQVLNGSGTPGLGKEVADTLGFEGFDEIATGNADQFGFIETEVKLKKSAEGVYEKIDRALNGDFTLQKSAEFLPDDSQYDVVITVGRKNN